MRLHIFSCSTLAAALGLASCAPQATPAPPPSASAAAQAAEAPFRPTATIQDIMDAEVDPSADALWDSVGSEISETVNVDKQPRTEEEWQAVRHSALMLIEATNLLVIDGRRVAPEGKAIADAGAPGILTPTQIQHAIDSDRATFIKLAHGLQEAGLKALVAIDAKNPAGLLEAGNLIDTACEQCHLHYWYPKSNATASGTPKGT